MLEATDLACHRGDRRLFSNVCLTAGPGRLVSVLGPNGSGKTSLLRILCGVRSPDQGVVAWQGRNIASLKEWYVAQLTYIGHLNGIKDDLTARENLESATRLAGAGVPRDTVDAALDAMGMTASGDLPTRVLSQGQRRRVALARLWISKNPLWILDEPYTALDSTAARSLTLRLEQHLSQGGTIVLTAHHKVEVAAGVVREVRMAG